MSTTRNDKEDTSLQELEKENAELAKSVVMLGYKRQAAEKRVAELEEENASLKSRLALQPTTPVVNNKGQGKILHDQLNAFVAANRQLAENNKALAEEAKQAKAALTEVSSKLAARTQELNQTGIDSERRIRVLKRFVKDMRSPTPNQQRCFFLHGFLGQALKERRQQRVQERREESREQAIARLRNTTK